MARPVKKGLDYFPFDVNFTSSRIARRLKRKYGNDGIVVYITLLCDIYTNGYFIEVTDDYLFDLADSCSMNEKELSGVIESMVGMQLFDATLYEEKRVLTSQSIQECYLLAKRKSHPDQFIKDDLCLVSAAETGVIAAETGVNVSIMPQRKEKKKKEKETKEKESKEEETKEEKSKAKNFKNINIENARDLFENEKAGWKKALTEDEDWQSALVRFSGKGLAVLEYMEEAMQIFDDFLLLSQRTHTIQTQQEYSQNFISWWRYHNFNLNMKELSAGKAQKTSNSFYQHQTPQRPSRVDEIMRTSERGIELAKQMLGI